MPLVSVVLPVYNAERYVAAALRSVLTQTVGDIEVIAIDDGSTDQGLAEIERIASEDARVTVVSRPNKGLVATLNEGVAAARGEWIARMDADDISLPERFAAQLALVTSARIDVCGSAVTYFGAGPGGVRSFPTSDEQIKFRLLYDCPLAHPSVMARSELLKRHPYRAAATHAEDYELWTRLARVGATFANVDVPLLRYRRHDDQVSVRHRAQQSLATDASSRAYITWYLAEHGLHELQPVADAIWNGKGAPHPIPYAILLGSLETRRAIRDRHIGPHLCATAAARGIGAMDAMELFRLVLKRGDVGTTDLCKLLIAGLFGRSVYRSVANLREALFHAD